MTAADDIRSAAALLEAAARGDVTELQHDTALHLAGIAKALAASIETVQDGELVTDGGHAERYNHEAARRRLRSALHEDVKIVTERGDVLEGPGGTQLVNGQTHDVERWIDRRSRWGNPFEIKADGGEYRRYESVELYRGWFHGHIETDEWDVEPLRGDVLGCWCLPEMCHGVVVLNHLAATYDPQQQLVTDGGVPSSDGIDQYDSINEFVIVGDFGFNRLEGPWRVEKEGTKWTIIMPYEDADRTLSHSDEGRGAVLIADGKAVGGGLVDVVFDAEDEGEQHVVVDQYARGGV